MIEVRDYQYRHLRTFLEIVRDGRIATERSAMDRAQRWALNYSRTNDQMVHIIGPHSRGTTGKEPGPNGAWHPVWCIRWDNGGA